MKNHFKAMLREFGLGVLFFISFFFNLFIGVLIILIFAAEMLCVAVIYPGYALTYFCKIVSAICEVEFNPKEERSN